MNVSIVCAGECVGLEEIDDGIWNIYFGSLKLGHLHERHMRIKNEHGRLKRHKVLPMSALILVHTPGFDDGLHIAEWGDADHRVNVAQSSRERTRPRKSTAGPPSPGALTEFAYS